MRCCAGNATKKARKPKTSDKKTDAPVESPPVLAEVDEPPEPVPMPPPYHHESPTGSTAKVLGPKRPKVHKDELPCQKDKVQDDGSQVRDVYLKFLHVSPGPPPDVPPGSSTDEAQARDLAVAAIQEARRRLGNGPYNNRGHLPAAIAGRCAHARTEDARGDFIWQDGLGMIPVEDRPGDPARLYRVGDDAMDNMPGDLVRALSLLAATTIKLQGGVCEKFSSLVMAILSVSAPPGTVACKIAWSGDHHYIVLRVGTSQWWVADPWPHNSFALPWSRNYFKRSATQHYTQMEVVAPVEQAYGVTFDSNGIDHSYAAAAKELKYTLKDAVFDHNWGHQHNLKASDIVGPADPVPATYNYRQHEDDTCILAADATTWG